MKKPEQDEADTTVAIGSDLIADISPETLKTMLKENLSEREPEPDYAS